MKEKEKINISVLKSHKKFFRKHLLLWREVVETSFIFDVIRQSQLLLGSVGIPVSNLKL